MDLNVFAPAAAQTATKPGASGAGKSVEEAQGAGASFGQVMAEQDAADAGRSGETVDAPSSRDAGRPRRDLDRSVPEREAPQAAARPADHADDTAKAATEAVAALAGGVQAAAAEPRADRTPLVANARAAAGLESDRAAFDEPADDDTALDERAPDGLATESGDRAAVDEATSLGDGARALQTSFDAAFETTAPDTEPKIATHEAAAASPATPDAQPDAAAGAETVERSAAVVAVPVGAQPAPRKNDAADNTEGDGATVERNGSTIVDAAPLKSGEAKSAKTAAAFSADVSDAAANGPQDPLKAEPEATVDAAAPREPRRGVEAPAAERSASAATVSATTSASANGVQASAAATPSGIEATQIQAAAQSGAPAPGAPVDAPAPSSLHHPVPTPESQRAAQPVIAALRGREGARTIEIRLDPAELGRVEIDIKYEGDKITVALRADRDDALDLMRRHGAEFLKELKQSGVNVSDMSFERRDKGQAGFGGGSNSQSDAGNRWSAARAIQTDDAALAETAQSMAAERSLKVGGRLGLDLRV